MKIIRFCILACILAYSLLPAIAQQYVLMENEESVTAKINNATANISSIKADFKQTKHLDIISDDIISSGKFYFRKDYKLRWEYTSPFIYQIVINNNNIIIRDEKKVSNYNAESNKAFEEINKMMTGIITGSILKNSSAYQCLFYSSANDYKVLLNPSDDMMKDYINKIEVYFNKLDFTVSKITLFEPEGDYTSIEFTNKKLNEVIPDAIFSNN